MSCFVGIQAGSSLPPLPCFRAVEKTSLARELAIGYAGLDVARTPATCSARPGSN